MLTTRRLEELAGRRKNEGSFLTPIVVWFEGGEGGAGGVTEGYTGVGVLLHSTERENVPTEGSLETILRTGKVVTG